MDNKKIPNPYGKKGCIEHQDLQKEVGKQIEKKGLNAIFEYFVRLITGKARFIDVAGIDKITGEEIEFHQIGIQTKKGLPVKRERDVVLEIEKYKGISVKFHPYDIIQGNEDDRQTD